MSNPASQLPPQQPIGLSPITLGAGVVIDTPVILAPMSGVTDLPFRRMARELGAGLVVSEMIASWAMVRENKATLRMAEMDGKPTSIQLAGCDPAAMAEAARIAVGRGADIVDINFGCPVKKVAVGQMAGSALMRDEVAAARILEATARAVDVPVTLKMRMGWDHDTLNAPRLAVIAEETGIRMVTVHGRTRQMFYTGTADWDFVATVKAATRLPVIVTATSPPRTPPPRPCAAPALTASWLAAVPMADPGSPPRSLISCEPANASPNPTSPPRNRSCCATTPPCRPISAPSPACAWPANTWPGTPAACPARPSSAPW